MMMMSQFDQCQMNTVQGLCQIYTTLSLKLPHKSNPEFEIRSRWSNRLRKHILYTPENDPLSQLKVYQLTAGVAKSENGRIINILVCLGLSKN